MRRMVSTLDSWGCSKKLTWNAARVFCSVCTCTRVRGLGRFALPCKVINKNDDNNNIMVMILESEQSLFLHELYHCDSLAL